jgi:hypothetical protein
VASCKGSFGEGFEFPDGAARVPGGDLVRLPDGRRERGLVAEMIDDAGNPAAGAVQGVEGPAGERSTPCAASERELVLPIVLEVDQRDRVELVVNPAALAQLPSGAGSR